MKKHGFVLAALALVLTAGGSAYAQGRHDEKPHGMKKEAAAATEKGKRQATGGRHDEGPTSHGQRRSAKKGSDPESQSSPAK